MTTYTEMMKFVGQRGMLTDGRGIEYEVEVDDVRVTFGNLHLHVKPLAGNGDAWIEVSSLRVLPAATASRRRPCPTKCPCLCHDTGGGAHGHHGRPCAGKLS